jgi:hypothetical protein
MSTNMTRTGGCQCGAVRYQLEGEPNDVALCHCEGCRKSSGAPVMAWAGYAENRLTITKGEAKVINSSGKSFRSFCGACGTGLFYRNAEFLPGVVEVTLGSLDQPEALAPTIHIQGAEQLAWMKRAHELPVVERFP